MNPSPRLSVSSWSLKRELGEPPFYGVNQNSAATSQHNEKLLALPAKLRDFGIGTLEICHFHLPSREDSFLTELRSNIENANIELWSLLVDDGDLTSTHSARDLQWMESWIFVASKLGAKNMRVIAGKGEPTTENLNQSRDALRHLNQVAKQNGVRLMIENWFALLPSPTEVLWLLDELNGEVGLCMDFGNWSGDDKYERLQGIAHRADSCHAKAQFHDGIMDANDYRRCLDMTRENKFNGPYTLIFDSPGDEWQGLAKEMEVAKEYSG